jgi:Hypothetical protein (DUF2513)
MGGHLKRDMDLLRSILLKVEESDSAYGCRVDIPGCSYELVYAHAKLAEDAKLIEAKFSPDLRNFHVLRLTFAGHEFLDEVRNDTLWAKAKEMVIKKTGTVTLEALKIALPIYYQAAVRRVARSENGCAYREAAALLNVSLYIMWAEDSLMPHPSNDVLPNRTCRVCGDRVSRPIDRQGVSKIYCRHLNNPNCSTKGNGEPK